MCVFKTLLVVSTTIVTAASCDAGNSDNPPLSQNSGIIGAIHDGSHASTPPQKQNRLPKKNDLLRTTYQRNQGRTVTLKQLKPPVSVAKMLDHKTGNTLRASEKESASSTIDREKQLAQPAIPLISTHIAISAQIYVNNKQHRRCKLTLWHQHGNRSWRCTAWSNIDARLLESYTAFHSNGTGYFQLATVIDQTNKKAAILNPHLFPSHKPAFSIIKIDSQDSTSRKILHDIHTLIREHHTTLTRATTLRNQQKPNKPKKGSVTPTDFTIQFWKNHPPAPDKEQINGDSEKQNTKKGVTQ